MGDGPQGPVPQRSLESLRAPTHPDSSRGALAKAIPRRPRVAWWLGLVFAFAFAFLSMSTITADRWLGALGAGEVVAGKPASLTIRVPALSGFDTVAGRIGNGGIVIARGQIATADDQRNAAAIAAATPRGALPYVAFFLLMFVLAAIFTHHMRRSTRGRLVRVQIVSLVAICLLAITVKVMLLTTSLSVLVIPVGMLAIIPTMALDRIAGLATGILAALTIALLGPFDVGVAILLLVQAAVAGLVVAEQPKDRWRAALVAGAVTTVCTAATYVLLTYLTTGHLPALGDPLHSTWFAAALGPAIATVIAVPLVPLYQLFVGEITRGKLIELEDLSNPLLRQIAEKSPGTWQHSLMMANMAEIAANAIGASGRLVRVGAYYHDLGKSLQPKYFIENLEPGETSPHDQLPPEVSCDAIFAHVTEGIVTARKAGLHERVVDFMHMHHGNGVLEYFWGKTKEQGNPHGLSIEQFRYPGHPPQSRETAILAICDAVEAASRTLKKPDAASIDSLVQRIVYGKLHLGQLDESGLSMADLRRISDSLRETIRHANHGRIEYPWQKAQQDASASKEMAEPTTTSPRLDSLDRAPARRETTVKATPAAAEATNEVALAATADIKGAKPDTTELGVLVTAPAISSGSDAANDSGRRRRSSAPPMDQLRGGRPPTNPPLELTKKTSSPQLKPPIELGDRVGDRVSETPSVRSTTTVRTSPSDRSMRPPTDPPPAELRPPTDPGRTADDGRAMRPATQPPPIELRPPSDPRQTAPDGRAMRPPTQPPSPQSVPLVDLPPADGRSPRPSTQPPPGVLRRPSDPVLPAAEARAATPSQPPETRTRPPSVAPTGMITPSLFGDPPPPREARKRAATLPPISMHQRPPTVPPGRRSPTIPPMSRTAGPPPPVDLENAVTNPPPLRRPSLEVIDDEPRSVPNHDTTSLEHRTARSSSLEDRLTNERAAARQPADDASITSPALPKVEDAGRTEPSMPRFDLPLKAPPSSYPGLRPPPAPPRSSPGELAARMEARLSGDEWSTETPVVAPTPAELRALLGSPDPTRQQSLDELERLHRAAQEEVSEPDFLHRRIAPMPTREVDPDDIEAAIEVAPPARRPNSVAVAKPKKSE